jgi:hypothetical protein
LHKMFFRSHFVRKQGKTLIFYPSQIKYSALPPL